MSFLQHQMRLANCLSIERTWDTLRDGLTDIYETIPLPRDRYMQLYNLVYQYCTSNNLSLPVHSRSYLTGCERFGERLYKNLQDFLCTHLRNLAAEGLENRDELLLMFYQSSWNNFIFSSVVTHHIFLYMNRHWIRRVLEDNNDVFEVYSLAMVMWRETLLAELESRVTEAVIRLITKERDGEPINTLLVTCIKQSYIDMGVSSQRQKRSILDYYKRHLESELLCVTRNYYTVKSSEFLRENSVASYVNKALIQLSDEKGRVERYLHQTSMEPVIRVVKDVLIVQYLPTLYEEFQVYLNTDQEQNMAALFQLVEKTENGLERLQEIFEKHVLKTGLDSIEACADAASTESGVYVTALLRVYKKYKQLVLLSFSNHPFFVGALDRACQKFINRNAVTDASSNQTSKSAELIARYCDFLLKKSSKVSEEAELEDILADIMIVFQYLESKDVFQKFYSSMLAKRLVEHLSMSEDAEASMISKLKAACGALYTSKLQKMFQDMAVNNDLNIRFTTHLKDSSTSLDVDFHVDVLTHGSWPFQQMPLFALPGDVESCIERFKLFYSVLHSGRKLIWLYHKSRAEIVTTCFKRRYTMSSSMYQVCWSVCVCVCAEHSVCAFFCLSVCLSVCLSHGRDNVTFSHRLSRAQLCYSAT